MFGEMAPLRNSFLKAISTVTSSTESTELGIVLQKLVNKALKMSPDLSAFEFEEMCKMIEKNYSNMHYNAANELNNLLKALESICNNSQARPASASNSVLIWDAMVRAGYIQTLSRLALEDLKSGQSKTFGFRWIAQHLLSVMSQFMNKKNFEQLIPTEFEALLVYYLKWLQTFDIQAAATVLSISLHVSIFLSNLIAFDTPAALAIVNRVAISVYPDDLALLLLRIFDCEMLQSIVRFSEFMDNRALDPEGRNQELRLLGIGRIKAVSYVMILVQALFTARVSCLAYHKEYEVEVDGKAYKMSAPRDWLLKSDHGYCPLDLLCLFVHQSVTFLKDGVLKLPQATIDLKGGDPEARQVAIRGLRATLTLMTCAIVSVPPKPSTTDAAFFCQLLLTLHRNNMEKSLDFAVPPQGPNIPRTLWDRLPELLSQMVAAVVRSLQHAGHLSLQEPLGPALPGRKKSSATGRMDTRSLFYTTEGSKPTAVIPGDMVELASIGRDQLLLCLMQQFELQETVSLTKVFTSVPRELLAGSGPVNIEDAAQFEQQRKLLADCCWNCKKRGSAALKLFKCKDCQAVQYCSVECQRAHWPNHKADCKRCRALLES